MSLGSLSDAGSRITMPRSQVGRSPQHLLVTLLGDYWLTRAPGVDHADDAGLGGGIVGLAEVPELAGVTNVNRSAYQNAFAAPPRTKENLLG
jgi:hypothetical protein